MKIYLFLLIQFLSVSSFAAETMNTDIKVYRDPNCQCCHKWIAHLEENKFDVLDILSQDMASVKESVHLPKKMASCHTAVIEGYVIEGHVPAADIRRLLAERPDIAGLAVPQMPVGTPGMEMGKRKDNFDVFQFNKDGEYSIFTRYTVNEKNDYQAQPYTPATQQ